jgi:hypothetical protein
LSNVSFGASELKIPVAINIEKYIVNEKKTTNKTPIVIISIIFFVS